ncbi:hypothetical protein LCGC14_1083750 [marine sediment metagenome]|uniref:Lipoprotein n=1 Tax=marine sediment metagenome TaxID=412755 RepID=A0A0F9MIX7_9ZZZZ
MKKLVLIISLAFLASCETPIGTINSDGTGYTINQAAIDRYGLDRATVERHEQGHLAGFGHCDKRACLMYGKLYRGEVKTWICTECRLKTLWRRK